jgi:hypothetical protein
MTTGEENMFDVRLNQMQIDLIVNALKNHAILERDIAIRDEIEILSDMFENVEPDVLNSFVD